MKSYKTINVVWITVVDLYTTSESHTKPVSSVARTMWLVCRLRKWLLRLYKRCAKTSGSRALAQASGLRMGRSWNFFQWCTCPGATQKKMVNQFDDGKEKKREPNNEGDIEVSIPIPGEQSRYISENQMLEGEIKDLRGKQLPSSNLNVETEETTQSKSKSRTETLQSLPSSVHIQKKGASHCNGRLPKRYNPKAYSLQSRPIESAQTINTLPNTTLNLCSIKAKKHDL